MRKQTKLVAVLSTAALLAIGASMTSFAAQGWAEEDGTWVYYNRDGEKATEEWKRSGDNWFWLDDNGEMAIDQLIEDDDDYYYVNESGAMVSNQWVAIENEDAGEEDEPEAYWYYFQANGKAYTRSENADPDSISAKTINGKKYAFDEEGKMLYGWVSGGERETDDDAWRTADYYFGDENDGAMSLGWRQVSIVDDQYEDDLQPGDEFWDEEQDRWFYFQSSGKKVKTSEKDAAENDQAIKTKTINGRKYGFDQYGRMIGNWYSEVATSEVATSGTAKDSFVQGEGEYSKSFMYFSNPEDGARVTRGWFKVVPGYYLHESKYDDGDDYWYYADGNGELYANSIETIKGKKYAFDGYGRMIDGLVFLKMEDKNGGSSYSTKDIDEKFDDDSDVTGHYDTEDDFDTFVVNNAEAIGKGQISCYYFGGEDDGAMKTGKQTVEIDGEDFSFKFKDSSSRKGTGIVGIDDDKLYMAGKLVEADKDDKYKAVLYVQMENKAVYMDKVDTDDIINNFTDGGKQKDANDEDSDMIYTVIKDKKDDKALTTKAVDWFNSEHDVTLDTNNVKSVKLYLVNSSGSVIKNKSSAKDGEEYKFTVEDKNITKITEEN